ncbi:MAG: aryl-sulfate sulfotransferase [Chloroflexota bacterium]
MNRNCLIALVLALTVTSGYAQGPQQAPKPTPAPAHTPKPPYAPASISRGTVDPDIYVDIYDPDKAWHGTTLLPDNHDLQRPRIIEVNMLGEIIWQYIVPENLRQYTNPGFDVELLPDNNVLFVLPRKGVYEINRDGDVIWSYLSPKVSHDADRLPNGNTILAFGAYDQEYDAQVREISSKGETVWAWYAKDHLYRAPYADISDEGWTHTNAVSRLSNGNTLVSLRNFGFVAEVGSSGSVARTIGEGLYHHQHDPEALANGNILVADHSRPQRALEIDPMTDEIVWQYVVPGQLIRDANRLPNGNTLITGATVILEVSPQNEIVWRLELKPVIERAEAPTRGFYKAERISSTAPTPTPTPTATPMPTVSPTATATPVPAPTPAAIPNQIQLSAGWNLISVPCAQIDPSIDAVFAETPAITKVHTYQEGTWLIANRGGGGWSGALTQIRDGRGYWAYATEVTVLALHPTLPNPTATPPYYALLAGFNLIGYTSSATSMTVDSYLASLAGKWASLYRYDATKGWQVARPGGLGFMNVDTGKGYWIHLTEPGTLAP